MFQGRHADYVCHDEEVPYEVVGWDGSYECIEEVEVTGEIICMKKYYRYFYPQLLLEPLRLRLGTDEEPCWCPSVDTEAWRRRRFSTRCPRPIKASRADHADHGPRPAVRP